MSPAWIFTYLLVGTVMSSVFAAPSGPDCSAATLQDLSPRVRTLCAAYFQLSNALQTYIDEQNNYQPVVREGNQIYETGVKRQDVDHVFLRFGRRR